MIKMLIMETRAWYNENFQKSMRISIGCWWKIRWRSWLPLIFMIVDILADLPGESEVAYFSWNSAISLSAKLLDNTTMHFRHLRKEQNIFLHLFHVQTSVYFNWCFYRLYFLNNWQIYKYTEQRTKCIISNTLSEVCSMTIGYTIKEIAHMKRLNYYITCIHYTVY